ncbi:MAG: CHAD domain-containing protein [Bacteroidia bacterium]|nr:CHAD domain-containing protein [Bacteroidia bacterium]
MEPDYVKLKEIKPALAGYIRESQALLKRSSVPDEEAVHDIRVLMKKSRAVMRLIVSQIDKETYDREYGTFREVGRIMCSWRETSVHRKTLKDLKKRKPGIFSSLLTNEKLELLMKKPEPPAEISRETKENLEKIEELLNKAAFRIRFQSMNNLDAKKLLNELDISYNVVVDKYLTARNNPKSENLHELRKKTKDFLYQLFFFRPLNPAIVKALEKKLDSLTQNLGKCNDLNQLILTLGYKYSGNDNSPALDELVVIIRQEQDRYLSKVWPVAYKIFCPGQKLVNILGFRILMI